MEQVRFIENQQSQKNTKTFLKSSALLMTLGVLFVSVPASAAVFTESKYLIGIDGSSYPDASGEDGTSISAENIFNDALNDYLSAGNDYNDGLTLTQGAVGGKGGDGLDAGGTGGEGFSEIKQTKADSALVSIHVQGIGGNGGNARAGAGGNGGDG